jgi:2-polyprenyl-6-hydroxyphenyl methylase/3-demethylubiquinone-9 3-methyltransferase
MREEKVSFSFGENWLRYVEHLDRERYEAARQSLRELLGEDGPAGRSFLDVGCGSGLFSLAAVELGAARVVSVDVDPGSVQACRRLKERSGAGHWELREGSVLDPAFVSSLGRFDVVYSWGVLHHTGDMWRAIDNAVSLVAPGGRLVIAIYNRTWSSPLWLAFKRLYNRAPRPLKAAMVWAILLPRMFVRLLRGRHPLRDRRGMSVYYDAVDWAGGLPYEYGSWAEVVRGMEGGGLRCIGGRRTRSTGCNEFVFERPA